MTTESFDWSAGLTPREPIAVQFQRFHLAHPEVYAGLLKLARQADSAPYAGRTRIGIGMLFEVLRWHWHIDGLPDDDEAWKLNNNYRSRYARLIMRRNPDLDGLFEVRKLTAP